MKKQILLMSLLFVSIFSCKDKDDDNPLSLTDCVNTEINDFSKSSDLCPNTAQVIEYRFDGELVYYFDKGDCLADAGYRVIDEQCAERCTLGTIAGITDCEGKNFEANAEFVRVVWDNEN